MKSNTVKYDVARYYYVARTVHLERLSDFKPGWFFFSKVRADFDQALANQLVNVKRKSSISAAIATIRGGVVTLEMPEPLAVRVWPHALVIHGLVSGANLLRRKKIRIVTYAIENYPTDLKVAHQFRIPPTLARLIVRAIGGFLLKTTSKVVFGTAAAEETYKAQLPGAMKRRGLDSELIWALPSPLPSGHSTEIRPRQVVFLGTFEERKGVPQLIATWPDVLRREPDARLTLLGKAGALDVVERFAGAHDSVTLIHDPSRATIFSVLGSSKVLVLFSQPSGIWREQVGLPILEGLASGCEIVSSDETGIADWLRESGHQVVPWDSTPERLAEAIAAAMNSPRAPHQIVANLPTRDSRVVADQAMFS